MNIIGRCLNITIIVAVLLLIAGRAANAETLAGTVVGVTDGDTITVLDNERHQHTIRLFAIDAPETSCHAKQPSEWDDTCEEHSQPFGKASKRSLSSMVFGKQVKVVLESGTTTYGRQIGTIWAGEVNANLEQVRRGYAMMYRQYAKEGMSLENYSMMEEAERYARENGLGMWSDRNPIPPWEYRHSFKR